MVRLPIRHYTAVAPDSSRWDIHDPRYERGAVADDVTRLQVVLPFEVIHTSELSGIGGKSLAL